MRLPIRRPIGGRRPRRPRRQAGLVNRWRIAGACLMVAAGAAFGWLITAEDFAVEEGEVALSSLRYTDPDLVRSVLAPWLAARPNLFTLPAVDVERALRGLPAVADSEVRVVLPQRLLVTVVERVPVFIWRTRGGDYLVDSVGVVLRAASADDPPAGLPVVDDQRRRFDLPGVGGVMERVDLEAVLKLAAVDPELLSSAATGLVLTTDDENGYVLTARPQGWRAVFGHYTPTLRPPTIIERQVQCLRALLGQDETSLLTIYLAPADDRCGTYRARTSPEPEEDE